MIVAVPKSVLAVINHARFPALSNLNHAVLNVRYILAHSVLAVLMLPNRCKPVKVKKKPLLKVINNDCALDKSARDFGNKADLPKDCYK